MEADDLGLLKETNFQSCGEIESNRRFEFCGVNLIYEILGNLLTSADFIT